MFYHVSCSVRLSLCRYLTLPSSLLARFPQGRVYRVCKICADYIETPGELTNMRTLQPNVSLTDCRIFYGLVYMVRNHNKYWIGETTFVDSPFSTHKQ